MASNYASSMGGHDAEWLLQHERVANDRDMVRNRGTTKTPIDTRLKSIGSILEITPDEAGTAGRVAIRIALERHACVALPACQVHGQDPCDCNPCVDPRHEGDLALVEELLRAVDLKPEQTDRRWCARCKHVRPVEEFQSAQDTCNACLTYWKQRRLAEAAAKRAVST
ncbi:hypothetical protein ACIBHX_01680 [Nonomuraea sp. NPDC050536]|uniref:hypothetical protein n=1 Tax=Nonomuraea sp. NPDC050536 TaxID=3364366 RepID=UPI0037C70659